MLRADPQPDGSYTVTRVTFDTTMPNGILVSPDQRTLYVVESNSERIDINRELRAYPINDDGSLGSYRTLHSFGRDSNAVHRGIDGMCLDADGNIVATAGLGTGRPRAHDLHLQHPPDECWKPTPSPATGPPTCVSAAPACPLCT